MKKPTVNTYQVIITWIFAVALYFLFWNNEGEPSLTYKCAGLLILLWIALAYVFAFKIGRKLFNILLAIVCICLIAGVGYLAITGTTVEQYKNIMQETGKRFVAYRAKLDVTETHIGGASASPQFYISVKNNSNEAEVVYIKAIFKVYDWESGYLKVEDAVVLLDSKRDKLTIKPGETETLKANLFDLGYNQGDAIKYELVDVRKRKYAR